MTMQGPDDYRHLPPSPKVEETSAYQMQEEAPHGGPGGGGGAVDGDGD